MINSAEAVTRTESSMPRRRYPVWAMAIAALAVVVSAAFFGSLGLTLLMRAS